MFDDRLIREIKKHRCIYDRRVCVFRSRAARRNAWKLIAQALNASEENCQGRWKTLRDRYVKEVNKQTKAGFDPNETTRWAFFHKLSFLKNAINPPPLSPEELEDEVNDDETQDYKVDPDVYKDETNNFKDDSNDSFLDTISSSGYQRNEGTNSEDISQHENPLELSPVHSPNKSRTESAHDDFERIMGRVTRIVEKRLDMHNADEDPYLPVIGRLMSKVSEEDQDDLYMEIINFVHEKVKELMDVQ